MAMTMSSSHQPVGQGRLRLKQAMKPSQVEGRRSAHTMRRFARGSARRALRDRNGGERSAAYRRQMAFEMVAGAEEWAHVCSDTFVPLQAKAVDVDFSAGLSHLDLTPTIGITHVRSTRSEVFRHERDIVRHPRDGFLIAVHGDGQGSVEQNGRRVVMGRGDATIYDTETPYTVGFPGFMSETVLQVPRRVLDPRAVRSSTLTARLLAYSNPALAALRTLLAATIDSPPRSPAEGELLAEAAVSLVKTSLALAQGDGDDTPEPTSSRVALVASLTSYVDAHLTDAHLTPESLARAHHVSLRSAQAVLAESGQTAAGPIRSKRLDHARRLLRAGSRVEQVTYSRAGPTRCCPRSATPRCSTPSARASPRPTGTPPPTWSTPPLTPRCSPRSPATPTASSPRAC